MPKIFFRYSSIYNQHFREFIKLKYPQDEISFPTDEKIINYIEEIGNTWGKIEQSVLSEMSQVTGLGWSKTFITCYVVGDCVPFSEPLTLKIFDNKDRFIDTLIHELIHQLFAQHGNGKKMELVFKKINEAYKNETKKTKLHVLVHAVQTHLYKKLFNEERLKKDIEISNKFEDYKRAWDIVNTDGYENILKLFK